MSITEVFGGNITYKCRNPGLSLSFNSPVALIFTHHIRIVETSIYNNNNNNNNNNNGNNNNI